MRIRKVFQIMGLFRDNDPENTEPEKWVCVRSLEGDFESELPKIIQDLCDDHSCNFLYGTRYRIDTYYEQCVS